MTERLFLGGPLAGWREVRPGDHRICYPLMSRAAYWLEESAISEDYPGQAAGTGSYTMRRWSCPGWRIVLTMFTCDQEQWDPVPVGTVLPGGIQGMALQRTTLAYWRHSRLLDAWRLVDVHGVDLPPGECFWVTSEIADLGNADGLVREMTGVPMSVKWRDPKAEPAPVWKPHTIEELMTILGEDWT